LAIKDETRGKPTVIPYEGRYTYDMWSLTPAGIKLGEQLQYLMDQPPQKPAQALPQLRSLNEETLEDIEDLYVTAKLLVTVHKAGGKMQYSALRKQLCVTKEKLAVYSWPDSDHSEKPLFEVTPRPPSILSRVFKLFGNVSEDDLDFRLTEEGKAVAELILAKPGSGTE
jgi:hypothetical protein